MPSAPGKSVEWIAERPLYYVNGGTQKALLPLPKFNTINISSALYDVGSSQYNAQQGGASWIDMYSGANVKMTDAGGLTADRFPITWLAPGEVDIIP